MSTTGLKVDPEKVSVIKNWLPPRTVKGVQSFLGFCNFYRRFIREYGRISKPLSELTCKGTEFLFTLECVGAFEELKKRLIQALVLVYYDLVRLSRVETNASNRVVVGIFS